MGQSIFEHEDFIGLHLKFRHESLTPMLLCGESGVERPYASTAVALGPETEIV